MENLECVCWNLPIANSQFSELKSCLKYFKMFIKLVITNFASFLGFILFIFLSFMTVFIFRVITNAFFYADNLGIPLQLVSGFRSFDVHMKIQGSHSSQAFAKLKADNTHVASFNFMKYFDEIR